MTGETLPPGEAEIIAAVGNSLMASIGSDHLVNHGPSVCYAVAHLLGYLVGINYIPADQDYAKRLLNVVRDNSVPYGQAARELAESLGQGSATH